MSPPFDQSDAVRPDEHLPDDLPADPMQIFSLWFGEAAARQVQPNPNAMTVATVDPDGRIAARILLCKQIEPRGAIVFFTNYTSRKGVALAGSPRAAAVFHWDALDRQVRIEGIVNRVSASESDAYFASRPWESKIGAWSSDQSRPIASREAMRQRVRETMKKFGLDPDRPPAAGEQVNIPRPPHWGGYRLWADRIEMWVSGVGRVHDRAAWERSLTAQGEVFKPGPWRCSRLQP